MMRYGLTIFWVVFILALALTARLGWIEREAAAPLLMIMPLLAWVTIQGRGHRCATEQAA